MGGTSLRAGIGSPFVSGRRYLARQLGFLSNVCFQRNCLAVPGSVEKADLLCFIRLLFPSRELPSLRLGENGGKWGKIV